MNSTVTKALLYQHFMGKTSALQKQRIDEWASEPAHEEVYYQWLEDYETDYPEYAADLEKAIDSYHQLLEQSRIRPRPVVADDVPVALKATRRPFFFMAIAASVAVVLLLFALTKTNTWQVKTLKTAFGETRVVDLPDGSRVTMNANSSLKIPRWGFGQISREVFLDGEASFLVKHTPSHQKFIVQTARKFAVEVLGTEFTVFSRARGAKVLLNTGKVQLNFQEGTVARKMTMQPGDLVTLDKQNHVRQQRLPRPEVITAWQNHRYVFDQTTLQELIFLLSENYGITAEVDDKKLLALTVSGTLTASSADHILELIETVLDVRVSRRGQTVFIAHSNQ